MAPRRRQRARADRQHAAGASALRGGANSATVWAKCEQLNPGGSVKDRICLAMIEAAERAGRSSRATPSSSRPAATPASASRWCARVKGYKLVLTMPESMSLERRALLEAYGVEIVLTPAEQVMEGAIEAAQRDRAPSAGAFMPRQFDNPANPDGASRSTRRRRSSTPMGDDPHRRLRRGGRHRRHGQRRRRRAEGSTTERCA